MLSNKFQQHGCETLQAAGDADLLIVQTTVKCAEHSQAVVTGEDTDLLVLLCMHEEMDNEDIIFQSETKQKATKFRIWDIKKTKKVIGLEKCCLLCVVHAISGCDTTFTLFFIWYWEEFCTEKVKEQAFCGASEHVFKQRGHGQRNKAAGENLLVVLYNGREGERLDALRYQRFCDKVLSSNQVVEVQVTSSAAEAHSRHVFLQVQDWMGRAD